MTQSIESMIEVLQVYQVYQAGKKIEYFAYDTCRWEEIINELVWNFSDTKYRVAPEPKKVEYLCGDDGFELRWWRKDKGQFPKEWIRVPSPA